MVVGRRLRLPLALAVLGTLLAALPAAPLAAAGPAAYVVTPPPSTMSTMRTAR